MKWSNGLISVWNMDVIETYYCIRSTISVNFESLGGDNQIDILFTSIDDAKLYAQRFHEDKQQTIEWRGNFGHMAFGDDDCLVTYDFVIQEIPVVKWKDDDK